MTVVLIRMRPSKKQNFCTNCTARIRASLKMRSSAVAL